MAGRSLLEWNLRWVAEAGITSIYVNLHYRAAEVRRAVEAMAMPGSSVHFSHEPALLGTAGAWRRLLPEWEATTLVVYGDNLTRFDLPSFLAAHGRAVQAVPTPARAARPAEAGGPVLATIALYDPIRHGNTGIAGSHVVVSPDGRVRRFEEARNGRAGIQRVSAGVYLLERGLADWIEPGRAVDFGADVFPALARAGGLAAHDMEGTGFCLGLDTPAHFEVGRGMVEAGAVKL